MRPAPVVLAFSLVLAHVSVAHAQATTFGIEWETNILIGIGEKSPVAQFKKVGTGYEPYYVDMKGQLTNEPLAQRLFCSTAPSTYDPAIPLVSWTYDYGDKLQPFVEIVSGPLTATDTKWSDILALVTTYGVVFDGACLGDDTESLSMNGVDCLVTVETLVKRMNQARPSSVTTSCYGTSDPRNLKADAAAMLIFTAKGKSDPRQTAGFMRRYIYGGLLNAWTQVNIAIDLENYLGKGVGELIESKGVAREAWRYVVRQAGSMKDASGANLSPELQGFVGLAFVTYHVLFDYMYKHQQRGGNGKNLHDSGGGALSAFVTANPITDALDASPLKNHHVLLPKSPITAIWAEVLKNDPHSGDESRAARKAVWYGRDAAWFCAPALLAEDPQRIDACKEFHETFWKAKLLKGEDPLSLAVIARTVLPVTVTGGKSRVVFEVREGSKLLRSRQWRLAGLDWAAPLRVPTGLP